MQNTGSLTSGNNMSLN